MAPAEKKQKIAEEKGKDVEMKEDEKPKEAETPKVPEPPKELETDGAPWKSKNTDPVAFLTADTTLNTLTSANGILMSLNEGAMQHFHAGARANVGISKGRYLFEVKIIEHVSTPDTPGAVKKSKLALKVGFSTAGSSLILGSADSFCFDADGFALHNTKRTPTGGRITRDSVVGVLLNLDKESPNFNTMSLFKDGQRATQPLPLPEELLGKTLFPHVCFKGMSLFTNFGPTPTAPLPFKCNMIQEAAKAHCTVNQQAPPEGGKYEVVYPVSLPDEGSFDWLDMYLEKNPSFTELSDRMIMDWARKSGVWPAKGAIPCNDKPEGLKDLDEASIRRAVYTMAPLQARNYIVMEVKGNLLQDERKELLTKFDSSTFKKSAVVLVGEPTTEFKKKTSSRLLSKKQAESDAAFRIKQTDEKRKKLLAKRLKEQAKATKKAKKELVKKMKEAKKKAWEDRKAKALAADKPFEEKEPEDDKEEEEEEEPEEPAEVEESDEEPPKVELTAEEKKVIFFPHDIKDLTSGVLSTKFGKFTLPTKDEGFDDVRYTWSKESSSQEYFKKWIMERKLTLKVEDLVPGQWALKTYKEFATTMAGWQKKMQEYKEKLEAKAKDKAVKEAKAKAAAAAKAAKEAREKVMAEKKAAAAAAKGEDQKEDENKEEKKEEKKEEEKKEEEEKMEVEEEEEEPIDFATVDIFGVDDVSDVGGGVPIFKELTPADWALMALRFELHLLAHAFKKDVNDPDRLGIQVDNVPYYYQKYFKKALTPADYGCANCTELVNLVLDAVFLGPNAVLESQLADDMETFGVFAKLAEDARRIRLLRIDLGEDAQLKLNGRVLASFALPLSKAALKAPQQPQQLQQQGWAAPQAVGVSMPKAAGVQPAGATWGNVKWGASKWAPKAQGMVKATISKPGAKAVLISPAAKAQAAAKAFTAKAQAAKAAAMRPMAMGSSSGPKAVGIIRPGATTPVAPASKAAMISPAAAKPAQAGKPAGMPQPAGKGFMTMAPALGSKGSKGGKPVVPAAGKGFFPATAGKGLTPVLTSTAGKGPTSTAGKPVAPPSKAAVLPPMLPSQQKGGKGAPMPQTVMPPPAPAASSSSYGKAQDKGGAKGSPQPYGKDSSKGSGKDMGKDSWGSGGKDSGKDWGKDSGKDSGKDWGMSSKGSGKDMGWGAGWSSGGKDSWGKDSWSSGGKSSGKDGKDWGKSTKGCGKDQWGCGGKDSGKSWGAGGKW